MSQEDQLVTIFKSLADPTRIEIVKHLLQKKEDSCAQMSKKFKLSQPTLSHHFSKLVASGVLNERKEGIWMYYSIDNKKLKQSGIDLKRIIQHRK